MAEQSRRFVSLEKPIDKFIEDQKNNNTLSKTRRDVSLLTEFLNSKSEACSTSRNTRTRNTGTPEHHGTFRNTPKKKTQKSQKADVPPICHRARELL